MLGDDRKKIALSQQWRWNLSSVHDKLVSTFAVTDDTWQWFLCYVFNTDKQIKSILMLHLHTNRTLQKWDYLRVTSDSHHLPVIYVSACQLTPSPAPLTLETSQWLKPKQHTQIQCRYSVHFPVPTGSKTQYVSIRCLTLQFVSSIVGHLLNVIGDSLQVVLCLWKRRTSEDKQPRINDIFSTMLCKNPSPISTNSSL